MDFIKDRMSSSPERKKMSEIRNAFFDAFGESQNDVAVVENDGLVDTLKNIFGNENVFVIDENTNWNELPKLNGGENE